MTFTEPAGLAGVTAVMVVLLTTATLVAAAVPNDTAAPTWKFMPPRVTCVPPLTEPALGVTDAKVGGAIYVKPPPGTVRVKVASSKFACACTVPLAPVIWHINRTNAFPVATVYVFCCCTHDAVVTLFGLVAIYDGFALLTSVASITHRASPSPEFVSTR